MLLLIIKTYFSITIFSNLFTSQEAFEWCSDYYSRCFPLKKQPCCEETNLCQYENGYYVCLKKAYLGDTCDNNYKCMSSINYSECSKTFKCECKPNYEQLTLNHCVPLLNALCTGNETCATPNSMCINNLCQCRENFIQEGSECRHQFLNETCWDDSDCSYHRFSYCSVEKRCDCFEGYTMAGRIMCVPILKESCLINNHCSVDNSICVDSECQCKPGFLMSAKYECIEVSSAKSCEIDADCAFFENSTCSNLGKCVCESNRVAVDKYSCGILIGDYCSDIYPCGIENTKCIDHKCQCEARSFLVDKNRCILMELGRKCTEDSDCDHGETMKCSELNICVCKDNFTSNNNGSCVPILNGFCSKSNECVHHNFDCVENKCQCQLNYTSISAHQCVHNNFENFCDNIYECGDPWHFACLNNECVCLSNNILIDKNTCYPILNGVCWLDHQCQTKNSNCIDYRCRCTDGFIAVSDNLCLSEA